MDDMSQRNAPPGRIIKLEINERSSPHFEGASFGRTGQYECLTGTIFGELDPHHSLNADITNLELAPRNAEGWVEYRSELCIIKPVEIERGNGWLLYEVPNRGTKRVFQRINNGPATNLPRLESDAGNGFVLREGYTIVWTGWQGDLVREPGRMVADLPIATNNGEPVVGLNREEFYLDARGVLRDDINEPIVELSEEVFIAPLHFPAADVSDLSATLTVRPLSHSPRETPADLTWRYVDERHLEVHAPKGYDRGALYEFIYKAKDPIIAGIGLAAIRDAVSFLRYETQDRSGNENPLLSNGKPACRTTLAFGLSQSGRMLREFIYEGFNETSGSRPVFDAMIHLVSGSRRGSLNNPFTHATSYSRQHEEQDFPGSQFPFTYDTMYDPVSGRTDGLLARATKAGVAPKILHFDTDSEFWSARASLLVTDCEGNDIELPENVRVYYGNGLPHGPFRIPEDVALTKPNLLAYGCFVRAMVAAMRAWVDEGVEPPPSRFPSRAAGTLVTVDEARENFPYVPGVPFPARMNELQYLDETVQPPLAGSTYPTFVAKPDTDGNGTGGITHPLMLSPIGTYTGWQLRREGYAGGELYSCYGGFIPFAATRAEREASGDARPSIEERAASLEEWSRQIAAAAKPLVDERVLLQEDIDRVVSAARTSRDIAGVV
jgi:hypothetical protein